MRTVFLKDQPNVLTRRRQTDTTILPEVAVLVDAVRQQGDAAIREQVRRFDGVDLKSFRVSKESLVSAQGALGKSQRRALIAAISQVRRFAKRQMKGQKSFEYRMGEGIYAGQQVVPIEAVAVYVPAGLYPLPSSLIMGVVPAQVAGSKRIVIFSPPRFSGGIHPTILATANLLGIEEVYAIGGATAIAAAAYGSESIAAVDMIVGPGNRFVTAAKKLVYGDVGIDTLAGPSEVLIVADGSVPTAWVAADLLAQAEHDPAAQAILMSSDKAYINAVKTEVSRQLSLLPKQDIARQAIESHGLAIFFDDRNQAQAAINRYAPEHLELMVSDTAWWTQRLKHFGSLFIGPYSVEALADYGAGPNHTLPTAASARFSSGLSVRTFLKQSTTLRIDANGFGKVATTAITLAGMEGLEAHKASLMCRLTEPIG